ncbi:MAG: hypothetical protein KKD77_23410 [Gammaproteobacteria bacterium]|nr:hypothetical protein [Gammaproteobacteria bacterium]
MPKPDLEAIGKRLDDAHPWRHDNYLIDHACRDIAALLAWVEKLERAKEALKMLGFVRNNRGYCFCQNQDPNQRYHSLFCHEACEALAALEE